MNPLSGHGHPLTSMFNFLKPISLSERLSKLIWRHSVTEFHWKNAKFSNFAAKKGFNLLGVFYTLCLYGHSTVRITKDPRLDLTSQPFRNLARSLKLSNCNLFALQRCAEILAIILQPLPGAAQADWYRTKKREPKKASKICKSDHVLAVESALMENLRRCVGVL